MGLDMYLYQKIYVSNSPHFGDPTQFQRLLDMVGNPPAEGFGHGEVSICVAYWRKANAVHDWFVKNIQHGEDDCRSYHVEPEQLEMLLETAQKSLALYEAGDRTGAGKMLTPVSGFFFGSTDINDAYKHDLEETIRQLEAIFQHGPHNPFHVTFEYHSSW